jgi:hypothetical protein
MGDIGPAVLLVLYRSTNEQLSGTGVGTSNLGLSFYGFRLISVSGISLKF